MNVRSLSLIIVTCYLVCVVLGQQQQQQQQQSPQISKRFEYKLSFKGPHMIFKDGTVPFWEFSGNAIASNDQVRVTPSIKSQKGRIWSKMTMPYDNWEIEVLVRVSGRGKVGADGMAIWYTEKPGFEGPVYGSNDYWRGIGIFLDSFDNDARQNNPYILVMNNNGDKSFDHLNDGLTQQLGGCMRDFRNKPFPVRFKIEYFKRALTVYYHSGLNNDLSNYELCTRVENVDLPKNGHFGVSAATGGLADDHDVLAFNTFSIHELQAQQQQQQQQPTAQETEEQQKYDREYQEFLKQLEDEKQRYNAEHPEKMLQQEEDDKKNFEGESERQFRMILEIQNSIHQTMRGLDSKVAEVIGRQETVISMLAVNPGGQQPPPVANGQQVNNNNNNNGDTIRRPEVSHLMTQQNELVNSMRVVFNQMDDVSKKATFLFEKARLPPPTQQQQQQQQQQQPNSNDQYQQLAALREINEKIGSFKQDLASRSNSQLSCPTIACVSSNFFVTIIILQTFIFIGYIFFSKRSEAQAKKFY